MNSASVHPAAAPACAIANGGSASGIGGVNLPVLLFSVSLAVVSGVLFGVFPALESHSYRGASRIPGAAPTCGFRSWMPAK